jgi:hypothetical protein
MKAVGGAERSRTRRGAKKRGKGSTHRRHLAREELRFLARPDDTRLQLALAREHPEAMGALTRKMERSGRAAMRIDKLHHRGVVFGLGLWKFAEATSEKVLDVKDSLKQVDNFSPEELVARRQYLKILYCRFRNQRKTAIKTLSSVWGLPQVAALRRVLQIQVRPGFTALPRVTMEEWMRSDSGTGQMMRDRRARRSMVAPPTSLVASNRQYSTPRAVGVLCVCGRLFGPGVFRCPSCGSTRDALRRPRASRARGNWRGERNHRS